VDNQALWYRSFGPPADCLRLERAPLGERPASAIRVEMSVVPVNPSDLIPVTGAYRHRITLPSVAGYEGVGTVIETPPDYATLLGKRVLPLRGPGTWQTYVDCDPALAVPVPDDIDDIRAARAYINPLAAWTMLGAWPVTGKRVLLTAGGSVCADLLGQWARRQGAADVTAVYRSANRKAHLEDLAIVPVPLSDVSAIRDAAAAADLTFDALGGPIGTLILEAMGPGSRFISYGLLSGEPVTSSPGACADHLRFHLRDALAEMDAGTWQTQFRSLWPLLREAALPGTRTFPLARWKDALTDFATPGRPKPMIRFTETAARP